MYCSFASIGHADIMWSIVSSKYDDDYYYCVCGGGGGGGVFIDDVSISQTIMSMVELLNNSKPERILKKAVLAYSRHNSCIFMEGRGAIRKPQYV